MKRKHDQALTKFIEKKGNITMVDLAQAVKVKQSVVKKWMKDENWEEKYYDPVNLSPDTVELINTAAEDYGLTEQEEIFCYHYLRTFSTKSAALKAGYPPTEAAEKGRRLLHDKSIKEFLTAVKKQMNTESFLVASDIISMYEKIAFSDINDYITIDKWGNPQLKQDFDGQLVRSVKKGKDGVSFELLDPMKALDKLAELKDAVPNKLGEAQLALYSSKVELEKTRLEAEQGISVQQDDGFMEAIKASAQGLWERESGYEEEEEFKGVEIDE